MLALPSAADGAAWAVPGAVRQLAMADDGQRWPMKSWRRMSRLW